MWKSYTYESNEVKINCNIVEVSIIIIGNLEKSNQMFDLQRNILSVPSNNRRFKCCFVSYLFSHKYVLKIFSAKSQNFIQAYIYFANIFWVFTAWYA